MRCLGIGLLQGPRERRGKVQRPGLQDRPQAKAMLRRGRGGSPQVQNRSLRRAAKSDPAANHRGEFSVMLSSIYWHMVMLTTWANRSTHLKYLRLSLVKISRLEVAAGQNLCGGGDLGVRAHELVIGVLVERIEVRRYLPGRAASAK